MIMHGGHPAKKFELVGADDHGVGGADRSNTNDVIDYSQNFYRMIFGLMVAGSFYLAVLCSKYAVFDYGNKPHLFQTSALTFSYWTIA